MSTTTTTHHLVDKYENIYQCFVAETYDFVEKYKKYQCFSVEKILSRATVFTLIIQRDSLSKQDAVSDQGLHCFPCIQ